MPRTIIRYDETPNPDALKCVLDRPVASLCPGPEGAPRAYRALEHAQGDPLARALLGVPGVAGVLIGPGWITISRVPGAGWEAIKPGVVAVLGEAE